MRYTTRPRVVDAVRWMGDLETVAELLGVLDAGSWSLGDGLEIRIETEVGVRRCRRGEWVVRASGDYHVLSDAVFRDTYVRAATLAAELAARSTA